MHVSGYTHPEGGLVVSPYLHLDRRVKTYDYRFFEPLLEHIDCIGRRAPVIRESRVITYIDPAKALRERLGDIDSRILELLDHLAPEWAGLTGSWSIFRERVASDIDLLVFGDAIEIYSTLMDLKEEGYIASCRDHERVEKRRELMGSLLLSLTLDKKLLDSCYKNYPYTLRILKTLDREPCSRRVYPLGFYEGLIRVYRVNGGFTVPTVYEVELLDSRQEALLETWHTRFMELPQGLYKGRVRVFLDSDRIKVSPDIDGWMEIVT